MLGTIFITTALTTMQMYHLGIRRKKKQVGGQINKNKLINRRSCRPIRHLFCFQPSSPFRLVPSLQTGANLPQCSTVPFFESGAMEGAQARFHSCCLHIWLMVLSLSQSPICLLFFLMKGSVFFFFFWGVYAKWNV